MIEENFAPYYSKITQVLSEMIPVKWTELFMVYYERNGASSIGMYFRTEDGILHWCHSIPSEYHVDEDIYDGVEKYLREICEAYKEIFIEETGNAWTCMSFHLTSSMEFQIEYYYDIASDADSSGIVNGIFNEKYQIEPSGEFDKKCLHEYLASKAAANK